MTLPKLRLSLFVNSTNSGQALSRLYKALEFHAYTDYELSIIDIDNEPIRAKAHDIVQSPTLIRHADNEDIASSCDLSDYKSVRKIFGFRES